MNPLDERIKQLLNLKKNKQLLMTQIRQIVNEKITKNSPTKTPTRTLMMRTPMRTPPRVYPTPLASMVPLLTTNNEKTIKEKTKTPTKPMQKTLTKTITKDKYANHPDYEYDTTNQRWVKKSDLRPIELVNRYKVFLTNYLDRNTMMELKDIKKLVNKHATSTKRLTEILVEKGMMTERQAKIFTNNYTFWSQELCKHMKKICPTETSLKGEDWCVYAEDTFCYYKDKKTNRVSCYTAPEVLNVISSSFTGGDVDSESNYDIFLQLPRDPYTRKVFTQDFMRFFLRQLRHLTGKLLFKNSPHLLFFLRNYKKFYIDPNIKPFLEKTTLNKKDKQQLSDAIEDFLTRTDEIEHGIAEDNTIWWFWTDIENKPTDPYQYIYK